MIEAWEEEQMSNLGCESVSDLIAEVKRLRKASEFIQKVVEEWGKPNQCNQAFGKDVRHLMLVYGLINYNEETRRYEVKVE